MRRIVRAYTNLIDKEQRFATDLSYKRQAQTLLPNAQVQTAPLFPEQIQEVDEVYSHLGIRLKNYAFHELYTAFTGTFDARYVPVDVYYSKIEYPFLTNSTYARVFEDKNLVPLLAESAGVSTPKTLWSNIDGLNVSGKNHCIIDKKALLALIAESKGFIVKPTVGTCGGKGILIVSGSVLQSKKPEDVLNEISSQFTANYIVQELIENCQSLKEIHPSSLNTFRVVTYIVDGEVMHMPAILRVGRGSAQVDNLSAGGILVGINDEGYFSPYTFSWNFDFKSETHPDSGYMFKGQRIPEFPSVLKSAKAMHQYLPWIKIVNWDFTIDTHGVPQLIEINAQGGSGFEMIQIAHGTGAFGANTKKVFTIAKELNCLNKVKRMDAFSNKGLWN